MLRTIVRRLTLAATACIAAGTAALVPNSAAAQDAAFKGPDTPVAFILDASRSMLGEVGGQRRMDVARAAMLQLAPGPLSEGRASLVSFGNDRVNECDNIPLIHTFGATDVNATIATVQTMEPAEPVGGEQSVIGSPLYRSLEVALTTLPVEAENGSIVLVTDGVDACDRNICDLVPALQDRGISVDILAIDVNPNLLNQLACVPAGTGGALLPSDNISTIESYARLLSRAAAPEPVDVQPYLDEIGRLTAELAAMKRERDELDNLRAQLDADLLMVFGQLDDANKRIAELEAALAAAQSDTGAADALQAELDAARLELARMQDQIIALDAAVKRCEDEKADLERQLAAALAKINELESQEPVEVVREVPVEVIVEKVLPDPQVVADLSAAKETLIALGCPFEQMDACEPAGGRETGLEAEIRRLQQQLEAARADANAAAAERDDALAGLIESDKLIERMVSGLALTATTYENAVLENYSWNDAVGSYNEAGYGMDAVRANRELMALVSREQSIQIIQSDTSGLEGEVSGLKNQVVALQASIGDAADREASLRDELAAALDARDMAGIERDRAQARLAQLTDQAQLLVDERNAAVKLAEERLAEILRLTTTSQEAGDELTIVINQFNESQANLEIVTLELERFRELVANRDDVIAQLQAEIASLNDALAKAQADRDEAVGDRDLLLEEIAKLDHTVEKLLEKNRELQELMDALSAQDATNVLTMQNAVSEADALRAELEIRTASLGNAQDRITVLEGELSELRLVMTEITSDLDTAKLEGEAVGQENQSLIVVLNELRDDIVAKEAVANEASDTITELNITINEMESAAVSNEAFFDILITQCTALLGLEGDTGDALDRETLAFECAAAFESAQRWRADLTEMVELRDRSLQSCEARYAALDTRLQSVQAGMCPGN